MTEPTKSETPRTDAIIKKAKEDRGLGWWVELTDFTRQLETELVAERKAYNDCAELLSSTNNELAAANEKFKQLNKDLGCELRDPNGTIWEYCDKLQSHLTHIKQVGERLAAVIECFTELFDKSDIEHLKTKHKGSAAGEMTCGDVIEGKQALAEWQNLPK